MKMNQDKFVSMVNDASTQIMHWLADSKIPSHVAAAALSHVILVVNAAAGMTKDEFKKAMEHLIEAYNEYLNGIENGQ